MSIRQMSKLLQVNRAGYYARQSAQADLAGESEQVALRDAIENLILEFPGYGYRLVTAALKRTGWLVNYKRVLRIMREESLLCHLKCHFVRTTDSQHGLPVYQNLIAERTAQAPDEMRAC